MRYRSFGTSDLVVSEVGFGLWTLASDLVGARSTQARPAPRRVDAGITFFARRPMYAPTASGTLLARPTARTATRSS